MRYTNITNVKITEDNTTFGTWTAGYIEARIYRLEFTSNEPSTNVFFQGQNVHFMYIVATYSSRARYATIRTIKSYYHAPQYNGRMLDKHFPYYSAVNNHATRFIEKITLELNSFNILKMPFKNLTALVSYIQRLSHSIPS